MGSIARQLTFACNSCRLFNGSQMLMNHYSICHITSIRRWKIWQYMPCLWNRKNGTYVLSINHLQNGSVQIRTFSTGVTSQTKQSTFSSLYVTADDEHHAILEPDLDLATQLTKMSDLERNIEMRNSDFNIQELVKLYEQMESLRKVKDSLETKKEQITLAVKSIMKKKKDPGTESERSDLIKKGRELRDPIKEVNKQFMEVEKEMMILALKLPVALHPSVKSESFLKEVGKIPEPPLNAKSHIRLGRLHKSLIFSDVSQGAYYMKGDLAKEKLRLLDRVCRYLREGGYSQMTCPDMVKSVVLEGCGIDFNDSSQVYVLENIHSSKDDGSSSDSGDISSHPNPASNLYLQGVSLAGFAAYFTKMNLASPSLPVAFFSAGTSYSPVKKELVHEFGLYSVPQSTKVELFGIGATVQESDLLFDEFLNTATDLYTRLKLPASLVHCGSGSLLPSQARRVDIIMWSPTYNNYFKVGEISLHADYISRRLWMKHSMNVINIPAARYAHTVHASLINIEAVIASRMEMSQTEDMSYDVSTSLG